MPSEFSYSKWKEPGSGTWRPEPEAIRVDVVGGTGEQSIYMRDKIVPQLQDHGYDANYIEASDWIGPNPIFLPSEFYTNRALEIYKHTVGPQSYKDVKKHMIDPSDI
jgi:hypothetical protein